jgi:hypothetical protein
MGKSAPWCERTRKGSFADEVGLDRRPGVVLCFFMMRVNPCSPVFYRAPGDVARSLSDPNSI